jgi:type IV pilus assembly protein PilC
VLVLVLVIVLGRFPGLDYEHEHEHEGKTMPTYQYIAKDNTGQTRSGVLDADTNSVAVAKLREQGLWVTRLQARGAAVEKTGGGRRPRLLDPIWSGVSLRDLAFFFRQFATMVDSGITLSQSLSTLALQAPNARLRQIVNEMAAHVQGGGQLSAAMRRYPAVFSSLQVHMIEAAEAGGLLDRMMLRIADYLEREYEIRQKIKQRTLYPKIVLVCAIFIPKIAVLIFGGVLAYLQQTLFTVLPLLLGILAIWVGFRLAFQWPAFRYAYDTVKLNLPVIGGLIRKQVTGRFARGLAALYGAGLPVGQAMQWAAEACGNPRVADMVRRQVPRVERGESLTEALTATGFFSPVALGMVATGEQAGSVDNMLHKLADYQEAEADHATIQLVVIGGTLLYLVAALFVAIQVINFYGGYARGISSIGQ